MKTITQHKEKNRQLFIGEMMTGMGQYTLVSGAYFAGFVHMFGGSDSLNGILAALPTIMGFMQVASSMYFEKLESRKSSLVKMIALLRVLFSCIYIVPILFMKSQMGIELIVIMSIMVYATNAIITPPLADLLIDSTPVNIRGKYLANKERAGFVFAIIIGFILGKTLDAYKLKGNEPGGFMIIGLVVLVLGIINVVSVSKMQEFNHLYKPKKYKLKEAIKKPLAHKGFRRVIILFIMWNFALQFGAPFVAVYLVAHLKVSYTSMMVLTNLGTIIRILITPLWGRIADQKSWYLTAEASIALLAVSFIAWGFVDGSNVGIMSPILYIIGGFAWGGIGISLFNIPYIFAPKIGRTIFIGLNATISGVVSLLAVWLSGYIIAHFEGKIVKIIGLSFNNMQLVLFCSGIMLLICPVFIKYGLSNYCEYEEKEVE